MGIPVNTFANADVLGAAGGLLPFQLVILLIWCVLIAFSSMCGGALPTLIRLTHTQMQILVSLIGGLMLGVGFFHQLPHAVATMPTGGAGDAPALDSCMKWLMFGLLSTFFLLRMFHFHSHEPAESTVDHSHDCGHDHDHDSHHNHDHDHDDDHVGKLNSPKRVSWIGIFFGLSIHTLLDGVALAAHVEADAIHNHGNGGFVPLGLGTFLGVCLHKPLDSLSITSLMASGGWSRRSMIVINIVYALICPIGAGLFYFWSHFHGETRQGFVAAALAISAGVFICISLSDLLPEVQFHSHDRLWLSVALLAGVLLAWLIGFAEPSDTHDHRTVAIVDYHKRVTQTDLTNRHFVSQAAF